VFGAWRRREDSNRQGEASQPRIVRRQAPLQTLQTLRPTGIPDHSPGRQPRPSAARNCPRLRRFPCPRRSTEPVRLAPRRSRAPFRPASGRTARPARSSTSRAGSPGFGS